MDNLVPILAYIKSLIANGGGGSGSGTTNFNLLLNRPKYSGTEMSGSTDIPEVKSSEWDSKQKGIYQGPSEPSSASIGDLWIDTDEDGSSIGVTDHSQLTNRNLANQHPISAISGLSDIIPNQASYENQLADKNFVNSSIGTNTAYYISNNGQPFTSVAELEAYSGTVTNNDYAFVTGTDFNGNTYFDRYKATVNGSTVTWSKEYRLNNSSFTSAQWASINSGITQSIVNQISQYNVETFIFVDEDDVETEHTFIVTELM